MRRASAVNRRDRDGRTALSHACQRGDLEAVKTLVRNNADPELADVWGNTALMYAAAGGHASVVGFLVRAFKRLGVQLDRPNEAGNSAAEVARLLGHTECSRALAGSGGARRKLLPSSGPGSSQDSVEGGGAELPPPVRNKRPGPPRPNGTPAIPGVPHAPPLRALSVLGTKLLRRFTDHDVTALHPVPGSARIPRSETFPVSARHPQVGLAVSVDSISSVRCEFDFHPGTAD